jgi:5-methyltetrahydrofolate--homocysteine methyltransferase
MNRILQQVFDGIIALEKAGLRGQGKLMIGGAPLNDEFARQIGADRYSPDASRAARKSLIA